MQQRVLVKHFTIFSLAHEAKEILEVKNPNINYKIRKVRDGFNVVRRFSVNDIKAAEIPNVRKAARRSKDRRQLNA